LTDCDPARLDSDLMLNAPNVPMLLYLKYCYIECRYHAIHKDIYQWFDIDFDKFGRTSTPQQTEIAQAIFLKLYEKNRLRENTMIQV
jgi:hypothetical protein